MKKILTYYCFIITNIIVVSGFAAATNTPQLFSAILFFPLGYYFLLLIIPRRQKAITLPQQTKPTKVNLSLLSISKNIYIQSEPSPQPPTHADYQIESPIEIINQPITDKPNIIQSAANLDLDRRQFIKLIGSAGISVFLMSLFTKRAQAAFFGSVPGPGTVAIKDPTTGLQISPAQEHPTDGYRISQLDDSVPAYYGFVNATGAWFIMREDSSGNYRYTNGASGFSTNWSNRSSLSYDYYDAIF